MSVQLEPEEEETHQRFRVLREGWRHLRSDAGKRAHMRVAAQGEPDSTPAPDRVVGSALVDTLNLVVRFVRNLFRNKDT